MPYPLAVPTWFHGSRLLGAVTVLALTAGLAGPAGAQVRPIVLENPSRPGERVEPPLYPPRQARLTARWETPSEGTVIDGLLAGPGGIVYAVREGRVRSLRAEDGGLVWEQSLDGEILHPPVGLAGRIAVVTTHRLVVLAAQDGRVLWESALSSPPLQRPTLSRNAAVLALGSGVIEAFELESGVHRWRAQPICRVAVPLGAGAGKILAGCEEGLLLGLDLSTGRTVWRRKLGAAPRTAPVADGRNAYIGTARRELVALGLERGRRRYTARLAAECAAPPRVREGLVLAGAMDNLVYALRRRNGHLAWTADAGARVVSPPAVRDGLAVISPPLATVITVVDLRDGQVLGRERFNERDRHSAAGPVWAGDALVGSTRSLAGGPGWLTGYAVTVEELAPELALGGGPGR